MERYLSRQHSTGGSELERKKEYPFCGKCDECGVFSWTCKRVSESPQKIVCKDCDS